MMFSTINDSWEVVENIVEKWGFSLSYNAFNHYGYVKNKLASLVYFGIPKGFVVSCNLNKTSTFTWVTSID
jgi:hypothetical protein